VAELTLPESKHAGTNGARRFAESALRELSSLPGVSSAGTSHVLPFSSDFAYGVAFEGQPSRIDSDVSSANYFAVSPQYFQALEIPLKHGRLFTKDDVAGSPLVTIVNETFASRFFPKESAVGKRIRVTSGRGSWREIVGVVGDTTQHGLGARPTAQIYEPFDQMPFSSMTFIVKTTGDPMSLAPSIVERIQNLDAEQPVAIRPLQEIVKESVFPFDVATIFLTACSGAALLIALTGVYGIIAYSVSQRTGEIGIRMALGENRRNLLAMILRQGMVPVAIGLIVGIALALALTRPLRGLLFETSATDLLTYAGTSAILASVSLLACYVPARRALRADPMMALRHE